NKIQKIKGIFASPQSKENEENTNEIEITPQPIPTPKPPQPPVIEEEDDEETEEPTEKGDGEGGGEIIIVKPKEEEISDPEQKANDLVATHGLYDHKLELAQFQLPNIELLKDYGNEEITINKEELEENKNKIVKLLKDFNIGIAQIKATIGATVTLYEIVPEAGIRVSAIKKLQDDIALNLSALGIRIIAPMPGKGTIGIEVPNKNPTMVSMRSVLSSSKFQNTNMDLPVVFGKTISNEIFMADLTKMPHLLMAGATGQGKSVGINAILASLLYKKHPSELKFVMVDPKKVELSLYSKIERHYLAKLPDTEEAILTDNSKVINTLNSLCVEMDNRYELLKNAFCRNLKEYNQKFAERKLNPENGHRFLPYIVLVVDEFADLIMTAGKEVEHPIARLAQLARAVGIHLVIATQRPSVNVITGMIKANFPARVSFRVNASVDSRTILDTTGAEQLIGKGDMLFSNGNDVTRIQCAFIDTPEVEKIAEFIGEQKGYPDAYQLPEYIGEDNGSSAGDFNPNERDALFEEAARIVVGTQQGSTSMLQRQLKLGYNRAGRIMDQLEAAGIVGAFNGAKARDVLITDLHSLEQFLEDLKS
ncbi:MAG: DNA translocase FtsK, partial [Flavobacteriaceae bacterium]|nr:DNA translocase FtsK [Flavobacteriaceae bacterium]